MLDIIVSWRNRQELGKALPGLTRAAQLCNGRVTVVNFGGDAASLADQLVASVQVVDVPRVEFFNKARAQNIGAYSTHHDVLFFCDCDILVEPGIVEALAKKVIAGPGVFATLAGVRESETNARGAHHIVSFGYELVIKAADGRVLRIVDNEEDATDGTRQAPGLLFVRREDFLAIGGYNGNLHGWGWEDQDMIGRLTLGAGLTRISEGRAIHISHDDAARIANYPIVKDRWESRDRMFRAALANYDRADFQGTYEGDVRELSPLLVKRDS